MYFWRKAYNQLLDWKNNYADKYGVLLEGARRIGKSTVAEHFAKEEYKTYIISQKDIGRENEFHYMPVYMTPFICE